MAGGMEMTTNGNGNHKEADHAPLLIARLLCNWRPSSIPTQRRGDFY